MDAPVLFGGPCQQEGPCTSCAVCRPERLGRCGLLWVGERFYRRPADFTAESERQGISRRISALPRGFRLGETWVLLAHPKALERTEPGATGALFDTVFTPGIFHAFRPSRLEFIITESQASDEYLAELRERGLTPVVVPDRDRDHRGTVYEEDDDAGE